MIFIEVIWSNFQLVWVIVIEIIISFKNETFDDSMLFTLYIDIFYLFFFIYRRKEPMMSKEKKFKEVKYSDMKEVSIKIKYQKSNCPQPLLGLTGSQ